jgi:hypothetical protein
VAPTRAPTRPAELVADQAPTRPAPIGKNGGFACLPWAMSELDIGTIGAKPLIFHHNGMTWG